MWKRKELKTKAKIAFKENYWACVLAAFILLAIAAGSCAGITSAVAPSAGDVTLASNTLPVHADGESIEDLDLNEIFGSLPEDSSASDLISLLGELGKGFTAGLLVAVILIVLIVIALAIVIKLLVLNPINVAANQFFKENALERTPGIKFSFNNEYKNVVLGMFLRGLYVFLWSLLFIIPGIIKSYSYRMVPFILTDNPGIKANDAITLSRKMMKGNKWKAFVLDLSFIGWYILSALTLGILSIFYVDPYVFATEAELYHAIKLTKAE